MQVPVECEHEEHSSDDDRHLCKTSGERFCDNDSLSPSRHAGEIRELRVSPVGFVTLGKLHNLVSNDDDSSLYTYMDKSIAG